MPRRGASRSIAGATRCAQSVPGWRPRGWRGEDLANALAALDAAAPHPDLAAACSFARRRRLGPFRRTAADHARELGAFARAGFSRRVAEAVLACADIEAVETLAREGFG